MGKRIAIFIFCCCWTAFSAQTVVKIENFVPTSLTNVCALTSTNMDQFTTIVGAGLPIIAGGSTTNSQTDQGWSYEMQRPSTQVFGCITNIPAFGTCGAWVRFNQFSVNTSDVNLAPGQANSSDFIWMVNRVNNNSYVVVQVDSTGMVSLKCSPTIVTNCTTLTRNTWYWIQLAWNSRLSGSWIEDVNLYVMGVGGTLTQVGSVTNVPTNGSVLSSIQFGHTTTGLAGLSSLRYSGIWLGSITSFADVAYPTDIIAPTDSKLTWFVNASSGSDLNSGLYGYPWQTANKLSQEIHFGGIQGRESAWLSGGNAITNTIADWDFINGVFNGSITAAGDKVLLDASGGTIYTTNRLHFLAGQQGVEMGSTNGTAEIDGRKVLSTFTQYDSTNFPNIWQIVDTDVESTLFENNVWMNNPIGADITAVRTNINTTPGSFFSDATTIYFSTFGGGNPNSNGKIYRRSRKYYDNGQALAYGPPLHLSGSNVFIHDIFTRTGPYRNQSTGAVEAQYAIQNNSGGRTFLNNCRWWGGGNHAYGATSGDNTMVRVVANSIAEQGSPWTPNSAGYANLVEFSDQTTAGNRHAYFINVDTSINSVIGSSTGTNTGGVLWHTGIGEDKGQYDILQFVGCNLGVVGGGQAMIKAGGTLFTNCTTAQLNTGNATNVIISNCKITGALLGYGGGTVSNTIVNRNDDLTQNITFSNTWRFANCTFDARSGIGNQANLGLFRSAGGSYYATNCVILLPQNSNGTCFFKTITGDSVAFDHNVFLLNPSSIVMMTNSTTISWSTWAATGQDSHSSTNDPCLSANYRPYAKTPTWFTATETGPAVDISGKLFQSRRTAGAYEYVTPLPGFLLNHQ